MLIETKTYWSDLGHPSDEDINEAIKIATENNIRVNLCWIGPDNKYYGGYHSRFVNPGDTFEIVNESMPKMYGL